MAAQDLDSVRRLFDEGWSQGDWSRGVEMFADDVKVTVFDSDGDEIELDGLPALQEWLRGFLGEWREVREEYDELLDLGDRILSRGRQIAEGRVSGAPAVMPIYFLFVFRGGKVVEFSTTRYEDVAHQRAGLNAR
jgi:ketosteroid isomerase-like protein